MNSRVPPPAAPLYDVLEPYLTAVRLAPYLAAVNGNRRDAIRIYQWNIELSGAVYEALHVVEVTLRNAIDSQLSSWNTTQSNPLTGQPFSANWLQDPAPLLRRLVREQDRQQALDRAQRAIQHQQRPLVHADLLAQMSFGVWRFLLPDRDPGRQYLWRAALSGAFPNLNRRPRDLVRSVDGIYKLRNRVAHLEPLLRAADTRAQFTNMRMVLSEIDPAIEQWFVSIQRVTGLLRARP